MESTVRPNKYWVYVDGSCKGGFRREAEAIIRAEKFVKPNNGVAVIELRFKQDFRLHVWTNGKKTVENGKPIK